MNLTHPPSNLASVEVLERLLRLPSDGERLVLLGQGGRLTRNHCGWRNESNAVQRRGGSEIQGIFTSSPRELRTQELGVTASARRCSTKTHFRDTFKFLGSNIK